MKLLLMLTFLLSSPYIFAEEKWIAGKVCGGNEEAIQRYIFKKTVMVSKFCPGGTFPVPTSPWECIVPRNNINICNRLHLQCGRYYRCGTTYLGMNRTDLLKSLGAKVSLFAYNNPSPIGPKVGSVVDKIKKGAKSLFSGGSKKSSSKKSGAEIKQRNILRADDVSTVSGVAWSSSPLVAQKIAERRGSDNGQIDDGDVTYCDNDNIQCLVTASDTCSTAEGTMTTKDTFEGLEVEHRSDYLVYKGLDDECVLNQKFNKIISVQYSSAKIEQLLGSGATEEDIKKRESDLDSALRAELISNGIQCSGRTSEISFMILKMLTKGAKDFSECSLPPTLADLYPKPEKDPRDDKLPSHELPIDKGKVAVFPIDDVNIKYLGIKGKFYVIQIGRPDNYFCKNKTVRLNYKKRVARYTCEDKSYQLKLIASKRGHSSLRMLLQPMQ